MPTIGGGLTTTVVNLVTVESLTVGDKYELQNTGDGVIYLAEAATDPSATLPLEHWTLVMPRSQWRLPGTRVLDVQSGMGIWARASVGYTSYSINDGP